MRLANARRAALILPLIWISTASAGPASPALGTPLIEAPDAHLVVARAREPLPAATPDRLRSLARRSAQGDMLSAGEAEAVLRELEGTSLEPDIQLLRAQLNQRLHRFEQARNDLESLEQNPAFAHEAGLQRLAVALATGHLDEAKAACGRLNSQLNPSLYHLCDANVDARAGHLEHAWHLGRELLANKHQDLTVGSRHWLLTSLAEWAEQRGQEDPRPWWQAAYLIAPEDTYTRAGLARTALAQQDFPMALRLTEGQENLDTLLVIRTIAARLSAHPDADTLTRKTLQRLQEAEWRGEVLHARDFARFLLHLGGSPQKALALARANWSSQKEPLDARILAQAAVGAHSIDDLDTLRDWVQQTGLEDAPLSRLLASSTRRAEVAP
ncbi:MAG: hypothetical protein IPM37_08735 [Hahellaceae bacterium]|nr:hypothetical protein [Hahellaceae bacterium]